MCVCWFVVAEVHRVRAESEATTPLHSTRPVPVQNLVVRHVAGLRVRHLHPHHHQHAHARHEGPSLSLFVFVPLTLCHPEDSRL